MTRAKTNPAQRGRKSSAALSIVRPSELKAIPATRSLPDPPSHLSEDISGWWRQAVRDFALEPHHLRLLQAACEAWDRAQQARRAVVDQGLTFSDAGGTIKANPAVSIERDARTLFARLVRELNLDAEPGNAN